MTRVIVTVEQRFDITPDGAVWSNGPFTASFWSRYLTAFNEVLVVARVRSVAVAPRGSHVLSGGAIRFLPLPAYAGVTGFLWQAGAIRRLVAAVLRPEDALILRIPSPIAMCLIPILNRDQRPYAVEVVGDAHDVLAHGVYRHPLRPLLQWMMTRQQQRQCAGAVAAAYVTRNALQARYPCGGPSRNPFGGFAAQAGADRSKPFTTHYSSIDLQRDAFVKGPRVRATVGPLRVVTVASLAQLYKGTDVLLRAIARLANNGFDATLVVVGDGRYRPALKELADNLGISRRVCFVGQAGSPKAVRAHLDNADLFVLPSRTEGLPRAMIEAMARALPCIGTRVGGIPELLCDEHLVEAGSETDLARKIAEMAEAPHRMFEAATRNLEVALEYREEALAAKRARFYREVRRVTQDWIARSSKVVQQQSA